MQTLYFFMDLKKGVKEDMETIKQGFNLYLYYLTLPVLLIFILLNTLAPIYHVESVDISLMISVVTFLFGFLISISFSLILAKVSSLKSALAVETGRLVSIFHLSKFLGKEFHERVRQHIDNYTVNTLRDYTSYDVGRESLYNLYDDLDLMEVKTEKQSVHANSLAYIIGEFESNRENLEYLTQRGLLFSLKAANYLLGIILIVLLFLNRNDFFTNCLFIVLSTVIIFILLIIEDYDDLRIGDYTFNISNSEQLFDLLGKPRYYPKGILNRVKLVHGKTYRVGVINYSTGKEKVINMRY